MAGWGRPFRKLFSGGDPPARTPLGQMATSANDVLRSPAWPEEWPFKPSAFERGDTQADTAFYREPRICFHIDEFAVRSLTKYYSSLPPPAAALDFCSSWVSHYPESWVKSATRVVCMGMNREELEKNEAATETVVQDLNADPTFPFEDNRFDVITNCVSVDYLTQPREVFREVGRVLRPGGRAVFSFSNRCFPSKAISVWLQTNDLDHCFIVGCYFHFAVDADGEPLFDAPESIDISPPSLGMTDPMYVVTATKRSKSS